MDKEKESHPFKDFAAATSEAVKPEAKEEAPKPAPKAAKAPAPKAPAAKEKEVTLSSTNPAVELADDAEAEVAEFAASLEFEARRVYGGQAGGKAAKWSVKGSTICIEFK